MNTEFIMSQEIAEIIKEFGGAVQINRYTKDEFGESENNTVVTTVLAYFYEKSKGINLNISISGEIVSTSASGTPYRLMMARDVESKKIRVNDEFVYNLDRYKIIDLGKFESAYFDMYCEVIK